MSPPHSDPDTSGYLSLEERLQCACAENGLQVQIAAPDFLLMHCPRCDTVLAGVPINDERGPSGLKRIELSAEELAQVRRAVGISADGDFVDALDRLLSCTQPSALRVAQQRIATRKDAMKELRSALYGADDRLRFLSLQLVSRMPQVPINLRPAALHAIQMCLTQDALGDEAQLALMALYNLAKSGQHLRGEVERIKAQVDGALGPRAELTGRVAAAVLSAIDREAAATKERHATNRNRLAELVREEKIDAARALLEQAHPADDLEDPDGGLTACSALCEAASQSIQSRDKAAARVLLRWSLEYAEQFAAGATAGGEGLARMVLVNRLRSRLKRLGQD